MKKNNIIFLNSGWMSSYDGLSNDDIKFGGAYIKKHKFGGEVYNFRNDNGYVYGYVQIPTKKINIGRISKNATEKDYLENLTCVFRCLSSKLSHLTFKPV